MKELKFIREEIEKTDEKIFELISTRKKLVCIAWSLKTAEGLPLHLPEREKYLVDNLDLLTDSVNNSEEKFIYKSIMDCCKNYARDYLQENGTYSPTPDC